MKKTLSIAVFALILSANLTAAVFSEFESVSNVSGKYLEIPSGAAASGMGNAYICTAEDAQAFFWNPAGTRALLEKNANSSFFVSHNSWIQDMAVEQLAAVKNFGKAGVFGAGIFYFNAGEMTRTRLDSEGNFIIDGKYSPFALVGGISYSNTLEKNIDFGIAIKYIHDSIDSSAANSMCFDIGFLYRTPLEGLKAAITAKNFGGQFKSSVLGKEISLGTSYSINLYGYRSTFEYNICGKLENNALHRTGLEIKTPYLVAIRAGYQTDNSRETKGLRGITFGAGIDLTGKYIDAAFEPMGESGNAIKVSFGGSF